MNWSDLSMSSRSELMSIYLKNGITSLDEMKKHYNSFAEGGNTSPSYPPFNKTPQRTDINDNEKRARGKWHVENAKENQQSIITKAFNEAKSKGLTTEQAYEYVADVAKQHGWSKEGSIVGERTIPYKASPNITSSDNNISPKYITSEPMSEEEYQRRKALQSIRQSQETGNPDVIYDSDEKVKRDNPNNPRTPFEPHPITPKEMDVTLKGLRFLQPFDPTGLTGMPDFLNSVASKENVGINFVGMLPAIGKVKAVENGSRLARFNNNILDTGEEVLGNLVGRVSPRAGNFINTTTSAVQDITTKPATEIVKQLMQKRGTQAANRFATGWNLGATTVNFGRAGEDVYDFYTEDPLVQRIKEGFQFAEGGNIDDPPYKRYYATPQYGFSPETSQTNVYQPIVTDVQKDIIQGKPIGTTTAKREIRAAQQKQPEVIQAPTLSREVQDEVNRAAQITNVSQPINTILDVAEYFPVVGDAISIGRAGSEAVNGNLLGAGLTIGMGLMPIKFRNRQGFSKELQKDIEDLLETRMTKAREESLLNPIGLAHMINEEKLIKTIVDNKGLTAAPSMALSRFNPETGMIHSNEVYSRKGTPIQLYFENPENIDGNWLYWAQDAMWPTYSHIYKRYPNVETLEDMLNAKRDFFRKNLESKNLLFPPPDGRTEAFSYARKNPESYSEAVPNMLFDLGQAKYAITDTQNPTILQWFKDKGISTDRNAFLQDPIIRFKAGGKLDIPPYTQFLNTLPDNLKNSGNEYNMRRYWELNNHPKDFNEGIQLGMFTKQDDGYHANSVSFNPITNSYEFMKDRNHPTYNMELDWYYSDDPEAVKFRKKYKYTPGIGMIPDQYTPRR